MGLKAQAFKERLGVADVFAKSYFHNYTLIGDAKTFRLSRTTKNQKDFKVESMAHWVENSDYSILCCPYFQYPQNKSQIHKQALNGNVLLFSWEYLYLLLDNGIKETTKFSLADCWNQSKHISQNTSIADSSNSFMDRQDEFLKRFVGLNDSRLSKYFNLFKRKRK